MAQPHHAASAFQMPPYTSHTSRGPGAGSPGRSKKQGFTNGDFSTSTSPGKPSRVQHNSKPTHTDSDQSLLEMLSSTVACLKQKHMDLEALGCLEQSLWLKRRMFGVDNSVVQRALNEVVLSYNSVAMQYLAQAQFDQCLAMLRKAEAITAPGNFKKCQSLQILTFNNIGCCYRKLGKLKSALKYLKEAAQIGSSCAHVKNLSITHLNLCAIHSQLGRHDLALEHAQAAIFHTQEELVSMEARSDDSDRRDEDGENGEVENGADGSNSDVLDAKSREEKIISLAVAYHNLAVELEFNGRGEASLQWYKKALQLVWKYRESNAALCASFKKIFMDAKKKHELQRSGGHGDGNGGASRLTAAQSNSRLPNSVASRSSNAFSGGDRRKPMAARPRSAHHTSSRIKGSSGGGFCGRAGDLSYSANVASQCYKPTKPSSAGLQYASPSNATDCHGNRSAAQTRQGFGVQSKTTQRQSSAASSTNSNTRQRPMSASAARSSSSVRHGGGGAADDLGPSIEAHWRKLEREFLIERSNPVSSTNTSSNNARASAQQHSRASATPAATMRPQSARPTTHSTQQRSSRNQFDNEDDSRVCGMEDDDDDCGVLVDDEPSESEEGDDLEDLEKSDEFEDLLLCRDDKQQQQSAQRGSQVRRESSGKRRMEAEPAVNARHFAGRDHRHHQTLEEARTKKKSAFEPERTATDSSSQESDGRTSSCDGDESDLPDQRVSHMEYLRRMKRLAENIKDDLTRAPAQAILSVSTPSRPSSGSGLAPQQQRKVPPLSAPVMTHTNSTSQAYSSDAVQDPDMSTTRRGSTSKVRERLERVRSESFHTLPKCDGEVDDAQDALLVVEEKNAVRNGEPVAKSSTKSSHDFVEIVEDSSGICYTTERDLHAAEQKLIRKAATKRIQAFLRGERARSEAHKRRQVSSQGQELSMCSDSSHHCSLVCVCFDLTATARARGCAPYPASRQAVCSECQGNAL